MKVPQIKWYQTSDNVYLKLIFNEDITDDYSLQYSELKLTYQQSDNTYGFSIPIDLVEVVNHTFTSTREINVVLSKSSKLK